MKGRPYSILRGRSPNGVRNRFFQPREKSYSFFSFGISARATVYLRGRNPKRSPKAEKNMKEISSIAHRTSRSATALWSNFFFTDQLLIDQEGMKLFRYDLVSQGREVTVEEFI